MKMKKLLIFVLVCAMMIQPMLAKVDWVSRIKHGVRIVGTIPCQTSAYAVTKVNKDVLNITVYYKPAIGVKGCTASGQRYTLSFITESPIIYVNGVRVR
jgi:hypothetical protein